MPRASNKFTVTNAYRNGLERSVGEQLTAARVPFDYEGARVPFVVPERNAKYLPDFRVGNIILESKGYWGRSAKERQKMILIRDSNPELDIRLIFSEANKKIYKGSPTTYGDWCEHNGFLYSTKGIVPKEWLSDLRAEAERALKKGSGSTSTKRKAAGSGQRQ